MKKVFAVMISTALCVSMLFTSAAAMVVESPLADGGEIKRSILYSENSQSYECIPYSENNNLADIFTNGEGRIDRIIVINGNSGIMPLYSDVEVPAYTAVFFAQEELTSIDMSVEYMPSNLSLYYGIATSNSTKPENVWEKKATGGSGRSTIKPTRTGKYYPYVANPNSKVMYADVICTRILELK